MTNMEESIKHLREVWFGASVTGDEFEKQALELLIPHLSNREVLERFVSGLVDQLKTGTIVCQENEEGEVADVMDTKLVSDVLHVTAVQIVQMYLEDYIEENKL